MLTNGDEYQFFTDLDAPNKMDEKPFLVITISDLDTTLIPELRKLTKDAFDLDSIVNAAEELKYVGELKRVLAAQFANPDADWIRFLTGRVYEGPITQRVRDQFSGLVEKTAKQFLNDRVNDRLKAALGGQAQPNDDASVSSSEASEQAAETAVEKAESNGIETTLGDNNRRPIAGLHFNSSQKYIRLFDEAKNEIRQPIDTLDEIYKFSDQLRATVHYYD